MIRKKTTKELLGESIQELARTKSVEKITVKEIAGNCKKSQATFYRHFHDKYELIAWVYNSQMEDIFLAFCKGNEDWHQTILDMIVILDKDHDFYKNALRNTEGPNSFFYSTHARSIELLTDVIKGNNENTLDDEILLDVKFYLRGLAYTIVDWYMNNLPYTAEELAVYLTRAMPERLKPFLR